MKAHNIEIIENNSKWDFEREVSKTIEGRSVLDIKFAVTPNVHSGSFGGAYSAGETYYAMIIFE